MPGENETSTDLESNLDAVAETLFQTTDDGGKPAGDNRAPEGDDDVDDGSEVDPDVDPDDVDLLTDDGDEEEDDDNTPDEVDPDEVEYEVTVDGAPVKAKLKDLKAAYSGNKAIDQRLQQAGEFRKQNEVLSGELIKQLNAQADKLRHLDGILAEAENNGIDWATLRATDPQRYLIEKDRQAELQQKRAIIQRTHAETQRQQQELFARKQQEFAAQEVDILLKKLPELANAEKARAIGDNWNKAARGYGFADEEVAAIIDHRMLLVLNDAMRYRALVNAKQARQAKNPGQRNVPKPLLRPGSQNSGQRMANARAEKAALAKAAASGSIDDVAATLIVKGPRKTTKNTGF
jgi:hypothetical protein